MSSFVGLYTGLSGIQAAQVGIDTTSHNVANANTPGYTRQRVELAARPGYPHLVGQIGTGVKVEDIGRLRNSFLDDRFRVATGDRAFHEVRANALASLEDLSGEPEHGLSMRFDQLWAAAETWANDPADPAARNQVLTELGSIAEGMRTTSASWTALGDDLEAQRGSVVDTVNRTLDSIADLNTRIANAVPGSIGPELYDQRDLLLDELAKMTGATVRTDEDGRSIATLGGAELVGANGAAQLGVDGDELTVTAPDGTTSTVTAAVRGTVGGVHQVLTNDLPAWKGQLDAFAEEFAEAVNAVNTSGFLEESPDNGPPLLEFDPDDPAGTMRLADGITAADLANATAPNASQHDGSNARVFADLRQTSGLENGLADLVTGLAGEVRSSSNAARAARGVASSASNARAAEHGVSLDEEMVSLVRYQRSLEAASRVMTTVDEALNVLVNRTGIVGR